MLEGLLWAVSPGAMKRAAALALGLANEQLRMGGLAAVAVGRASGLAAAGLTRGGPPGSGPAALTSGLAVTSCGMARLGRLSLRGIEFGRVPAVAISRRIKMRLVSALAAVLTRLGGVPGRGACCWRLGFVAVPSAVSAGPPPISFADIVERVAPAVVNISTTKAVAAG